MIPFFRRKVDNIANVVHTLDEKQEQRLKIIEQTLENLHLELISLKAKARKKLYQEAFGQEDKKEQDINSSVLLPWNGETFRQGYK